MLEPVVQSRTEMLQKSALKVYLMQRNLGRPRMQRRGARALAGAGAVSKPALGYFVVVNLTVNFLHINRSGGSRGFVA